MDQLQKEEVALLDEIPQPKLSSLERNRKQLVLTPAAPLGSLPSEEVQSLRNLGRKSDPKTITAIQRLRDDFPDEFKSKTLSHAKDRIFCTACCSSMGLKLDTIKRHLKSQSHKEKLIESNKKKLRSQTFCESVTNMQVTANTSGSTLAASDQEFRADLLKCLLACGIPLSVVDNSEMKNFIARRCAFSLPNSSDFRKMIPFAHQAETKALLDEIGKRPYSIIFDGASRMGHCMAIIVRFVDQQ